MSLHRTIGQASAAPPRVDGTVMRSIHWITLSLLVSEAHTLAWSVDGTASRDEAAWLVMMHRSLGLSVLLLTLFRLYWRRTARVPALPDDVPLLQRLAAQTVAAALYLLLLQPLLGLIASQAHGDRISAFGLFVLPSVIATDRALSHQIFALHGSAAIVLLILIGMKLAALYHHVIRRDQVLAGMLAWCSCLYRPRGNWIMCRNEPKARGRAPAFP